MVRKFLSPLKPMLRILLNGQWLVRELSVLLDRGMTIQWDWMRTWNGTVNSERRVGGHLIHELSA